MATFRIVLGMVCLALFGRAVEPGGYILGREEGRGLGVGVEFRSLGAREEGRGLERCKVEKVLRRGGGKLWILGVVESSHRLLTNLTTNQLNQRQLNNLTTNQLTNSTITAIAQSQLGVREKTGNNDGLAVERYLNYTGNKKGEPWCASFVSWVYGQAGFAQPKTAWSPGLFPLARQTLQPKVAAVFGIYFVELGRIAHCGLVEKKQGNWLTTIEGNTNVTGSREGDGVYRKLRHLRTIKVFADWVNEPRKGEVK